MRSMCFRRVFALSGAAILILAGFARAQNGPTLQIRTHFPAQYDTADGWLPAPGNASVHIALADPTIAAGAVDGGTRLLVGANDSIGNFFDALKGNDNVHNSQQGLASAFDGVLPAGFSIFQPQVLRDTSTLKLPGMTQTIDRYVTIALASNSSTHENRIFISATKYDLSSVYSQCLFSFNVNDSTANSFWADSLEVGTSGNAVLMTVNLYSYSDNVFRNAKLFMLPKASIYNDPSLANCPSSSGPRSLVLNIPNADGSMPFSVVPARSADTSPTAYMVNSLSNGGSALTVWELDTTDPTVIKGHVRAVSTNPYSVPPNAQQAGTSALVSIAGTRLFNAVYQPNSGIWTVNTTGCTPAGDTAQRSCLQWYFIDPSSFTTRQQGLVQAPGWYFYAPSIAANAKGDAVLGFNGSAANQYISMLYTGHYHADPPNTVQTIWRASTGAGCYQTRDGRNSVSDHSDALVDPINDSMFWLHSAVTYGGSATCLSNDWATEVAAVQFVGGSSSN